MVRPLCSIVTHATVFCPARQRTPLAPIFIVSAVLPWTLGAACSDDVVVDAAMEDDDVAAGWSEFVLHAVGAMTSPAARSARRALLFMELPLFDEREGDAAIEGSASSGGRCIPEGMTVLTRH
ncbi:hypothetical protein AOT86_11290 [Mycobacteroides sp. H072]|nr:hypothetical protein AOT86_11290 [Mycobacteroides sp. H072]